MSIVLFNLELDGSTAFSSHTFSCINTPAFLKSSHTSYPPAYEDGADSVLKRRHIKFRRRGITQKKAYNLLSFTLMVDRVLKITGTGMLLFFVERVT